MPGDIAVKEGGSLQVMLRNWAELELGEALVGIDEVVQWSGQGQWQQQEDCHNRVTE